MLDERNAEEAMTSPERFRSQPGEVDRTAGGVLEVRLLPFGLTRLDWM
jgi:hypothetical protein